MKDELRKQVKTIIRDYKGVEMFSDDGLNFFGATLASKILDLIKSRERKAVQDTVILLGELEQSGDLNLGNLSLTAFNKKALSALKERGGG